MASLPLGWLGFVAILFGVLNLLIQLASGGIFLGVDQPWIWGNFLLGIVLLGIAASTNLDSLRERLKTGEARRASKYGTSAILSTVLGIVLLGLLTFMANRYHVRFDWTEARSHSLSEQTLKVLDSLEQDVQVTAFFSAIGASSVRDMLQRYEYVSERFKVRYADPQAEPGLVASLGVDKEKLGGGLIHVQIGEESVELTGTTEEDLTNTLVKLTRLERKKVYFLEGHGERPIEGEGADGGEGFEFARDALRNENYETARLFLAQTGDVPEDADVLIIAGATRPFHESEHRALERFLARGGALMVLIDPRANTDLDLALEQWGIQVGRDIVVDRVQGLFGRPVSPFAGSYGEHPITEGMREATLFHVARSVRPVGDADGRLTVLVNTGEQSWGERDLEVFESEGRAGLGADDLPGPVPVALAGTVELGAGDEEAGAENGSEARIVVVGDSDFASNQLIGEYRNRDLFLNSANWLLGDVEAIAIRPDPPRASRLQLSQEQFLQIRYLSLFVMPQLIAVIGVFAWWSRRRAPGR